MALYLGISQDGTFVSSDNYVLQDSDSLDLNALPTANKCKIILDNVVYCVNVYLPENTYQTLKENE